LLPTSRKFLPLKPPKYGFGFYVYFAESLRIFSRDGFEATAAPDTTQKNSVEERFVSFREPALEAGTVVWNGEQGRCTLEFDSEQMTPSAESFEVGRGNSGEKQTAYLLKLILNDIQDDNEVRMRFHVSTR